MTLSDPIRAFLTSDLRFATIATIDPDGAPRQAVIWYLVDGDEIVINSLVGRRWPTNLLRDPRISISIANDDGYHYVVLTGVATAVTDVPTARADIATMARRYHADEPDRAETMILDRFSKQERISFRIHPDTAYEHID
jgi:PPOX class probable F420-dependent enzyme